MSETVSSRRPRRRSPWPRRGVILAFILVIFSFGVALGQALDDGPPQPSTGTYVRTLEPLPQQPVTTAP